MIRIQVDQEWRQWLFGLDKAIEFCDDSGKVVGQFVPSEEVRLARQRMLAVTDDELDRIRDEEGEFTLAEIIRDLEKSTDGK